MAALPAAFPDDAPLPERSPRSARLFIGQLALDNRRVIKIRIRNISTGGFGARSETPPLPGQTGHMLLPGIGVIGGTVAWARGECFGFTFDAPIDPGDSRVPVSGPRPVSGGGHHVPDRFKPVADARRPGFGPR